MIPQIEPWLGAEELARISECLDDKWITGGKKVTEFEQKIAELCGVTRAVACVNGTMALYMGLKAIGIGPGDEVIVPDFTFIASANAVVLVGATPVFVDVDQDTLNIDSVEILRVMTRRTKAIMPVHLYGQSADMDGVMRVADKFGLAVIEDNAQGIGVTWNGKPTGGFGDVSCVSFYADKVLTTGEGGMVLTDDDEIADSCLRLAHQGNLQKGRYIHETVGFNFRMTDLQAAVGLAQLDKLPRTIEVKRDNDALYRMLLDGIVEFLSIDGRCHDVPFKTVILVNDPDGLAAYLVSNGIEAKRLFYPLHKQPCYDSGGTFPNSERAYQRGLTLPSSVLLTEKMIEYICTTIRRFYGAS